jgi:polysaccharide pyruvyl transferase WcaK-like protein
MNRSGHGVILGGGNLYENGEIDVDVESLKALDIPLMVYSVSRGRIFNKRNELVDRTDVISDSKLKAISDAAKFNYVRDIATAKYIKDLGIQNVHVGACPTLFLGKYQNFTIEEEYIKKYISDKVVISIRNPSLMSIPANSQQKVREDISQFIDYSKNVLNKEAIILCHDLRDIDYAESISCDHLYTGDIYSYLTIIKFCHLLISYRLHSFLPAISYRKDAIKISYDERAISLIDTFSMNSWNINMLKDNVMDSVIDRINNMDRLQNLIIENEEKWNQIDSSIENLFNEFAVQVKKNV